MHLHRSRLGRGRRALSAAGGLVVAVTLLVGVTALPAAAVVFANGATITIPTSGQATPYPSTITVAGLAGTVVDVNVTLTGVSHYYSDDIDVLLIGPFGQNVVLMTDCGGSNSITNVNLTFDGQVAGMLPDTGQIVQGTYQPTPNGTFDGPTSAWPFGYLLSAFNGTNPNGAWNLYVFDDDAGALGSISGGWSLDITTNGPRITSFNPTSGGPGAPVVITGTNFTGATSVTFGGVSATFSVVSATQINTTVPSGAVTGPIAVTTPNGTGTSSTNFTVTPAPTITLFMPTRGTVGTSVVITGAGFTGATAVAFHGTPATVFTVNSDTQITATVPAGASTGPIAITTPGGTGTSATNFVVRHARDISLTLGRRARGTVNVTDGFAACALGVPVRVQHYNGVRWVTVASVLTNASGNYSAAGVSAWGSYRAIARATTLGSGDKCMKDISPTATR